MKKLIILSSLFIFLLSNALAQAPDTAWTKTYHRSDMDECRFIEELSDGGFALVGQSHNYSANAINILLVRIDSNGDVLWTHTYGDGVLGQQAFCVKEDNNGGLVIAGLKYLTPILRNTWIIKTNDNGDTLWTVKYGGTTNTEAMHISCTSDNGYIVTGMQYDPGKWANAFLLKLDQNGEIKWAHSFGDEGYQVGNSVQQTSDGGYMLAGSSQALGKGYEFYMIKTDDTGNIEWSKTYGGVENDYCTSAQQTSDNGYIMFGESDSYIYNSSLAFRTNATGDSIWCKTYSRSVGDYGWSVNQTADNGFIFGGYSNNPGKFDDFWFVRTDTKGDTLWMKTVGYADAQRGYCVLQSKDGGYIMAGSSVLGIETGTDFYVVKLMPTYTNIDDNNILPSTFELDQNYPNPFNLNTEISFHLKTPSHVILKVFDPMGKEVKTLADQVLAQGDHQVTFDASGLPTGIYYYQLQANNRIMIKKMVICK